MPDPIHKIDAHFTRVKPKGGTGLKRAMGARANGKREPFFSGNREHTEPEIFGFFQISVDRRAKIL
jgi:hypothetical protein